MRNPFKLLSKKEIVLLILSLILVSVSTIMSGILSGNFSPMTLAASVIGVTAVLLCAKGNVWGQILIAVFAVFYAVISWQFRYYGEMATYMLMSFPMAVWSIITWIKNPSEEDRNVVRIKKLYAKHYAVVGLSGCVVTFIFYLILRYFNTPNVIWGTVSVLTSFAAAAFTMLRSPLYGFWYAMNDLVLIVLWSLASIKNPVYIPMIINFVVFFVNDSYGFYSWKKREKMQK